MFIIDFFKDTLDGWPYLLYIIFCLICIFAFLGVIGERKKKEIIDEFLAQRKLEKEQGLDKKRAALAGKQVISVVEDMTSTTASINASLGELKEERAVLAQTNEPTKENATPKPTEPTTVQTTQPNVTNQIAVQNANSEAPKEEVPTVLVLDSEEAK